jgi:RHS repeat-associated protein
MPVQLSFPAVPTSQDIFRARIFDEPLTPVGPKPTPRENVAFTDALVRFAKRSDAEDFSSLTGFLDAHEGSPWALALLTNLGLVYYRAGYYSNALQAWGVACGLARPITHSAQKPLADRAIGELAYMLARVGRMTELGELLQSVEGRQFFGLANERIVGAREGLVNMHAHPETSFRCGPLALHRIMLIVHPDDPRSEMIDASKSTQRGFSLREVAALSWQLGLNYEMAFRGRGAAFITPSVVHLKIGHFAAMIRRDGDRYLLQDPTFKNDAWVSREALEAESSGYFLVPPKELSAGWRSVAANEAELVWGRGNVPDPPEAPGPCDHSTDCRNSCSGKGMAVARVHLLNVSLNITDEPVGYVPPVGQVVRFTVRYNQRDNQFATAFNYSNFGRLWTCDWIAFIKDDPSKPSDPVTYYMAGGGNRTYTALDGASGTYAFQLLDQTKLVRTSTSAYEMTAPDGTRMVFAQSDGGVATRRCFLTKRIDPFGNAVTLTYDSDFRIAAITDAIGQATTLQYEDPDTFKITGVTDPFGRSATFAYENDKLTRITDVIGLYSAFAYESVASDFITTLTTPYGVTTFTKGEDGTTRSLEILYPDGDRERVEFNQNTDLGIPASDPAPSIPVGMATRNVYLAYRNTYHWDRQGCAYAYGDHTKARVFHWLHSTDLRSPVGILESRKEPLEARVWYDYAGQVRPDGPIVVGSTSKPTHVGRVLDDGSTQLLSYEHNDFGHVIKTIDPVGRTFSYVYAENGIDLLEGRQTRAGQSELLFQATYNAQHLPLTSRDAAGQTTTYTYNARGQLLTEVNARGDTTTHHYDVNGYRTSVDGPLGVGDTNTWTYDACGLVRTKTDVSGYTLAFDYDKLDRLTAITYPDTTFDQFTYTLLNTTQVLDRAKRVTSFEFDSNRQMTKRTDPLKRTTLFQWCKCGALRRLTDPMGRTTTWRHDVQGRIKSKEYADGSRVTYLYEDTTSRIRQRIDETLQVTQYNYNRDDTTCRISYTNAAVATPAVVFAYDANYPRLSSMTDGIGTTLYSYVPISSAPMLGVGRLASVNGPLPNETITYSYDEVGRCISTAINGVGSALTFDAAGRVESANNALGSFRYAYDGSSIRNTSQTNPNGLSTEMNYGDDAQDHALLRITNKLGAVLLSEFVYARDVLTGQIASWSQQMGAQEATVWKFGYDATDQVISAIASRGSTVVNAFEYNYDSAANRLSEQIESTLSQFSYNALNQLTSVEGDDGVATTYEWDAEHRLKTVNSGNQSTQFTYDGLGRRVGIRRVVDGSEVSDRRFVWSGNDICEERTSGGVVSKRFFAQGMKLESGAAAGAYFYTHDHLGSIRELIDSNGTLRARYSYDPFGRSAHLMGDLESDFGFARMLWAAEVGLNLTKFRVYAPALGRWLSRDVLENAELLQGANLYAYVRNNPVNLTDSLGAEPDWTQGFAAKLLAFAVKLIGELGGDDYDPKMTPIEPPGNVQPGPRMPGPGFEGPHPPPPPPPPPWLPPPSCIPILIIPKSILCTFSNSCIEA